MVQDAPGSTRLRPRSRHRLPVCRIGRESLTRLTKSYILDLGTTQISSYFTRKHVLLAIACHRDWLVCQVDVQQVANLQSRSEGNVFVKVAPGHDTKDMKTQGSVLMKPKRSLYGVSESPALWHHRCSTPGGWFHAAVVGPLCFHTWQ